MNSHVILRMVKNIVKNCQKANTIFKKWESEYEFKCCSKNDEKNCKKLLENKHNFQKQKTKAPLGNHFVFCFQLLKIKPISSQFFTITCIFLKYTSLILS